MDYQECKKCGNVKYTKDNGRCVDCNTKNLVHYYKLKHSIKKFKRASSKLVAIVVSGIVSILLLVAFVILVLLFISLLLLFVGGFGAGLGAGIVFVFNSLLGTTFSWKLGALVGAFLSIFTGGFRISTE